MRELDPGERSLSVDGTASIAFTVSIPPTTRPKAVYFWSREAAVPVTMKNDVEPLSGSSPWAMDRTPGS